VKANSKASGSQLQLILHLALEKTVIGERGKFWDFVKFETWAGRWGNDVYLNSMFGVRNDGGA
jgi:hypothetical protein